MASSGHVGTQLVRLGFERIHLDCLENSAVGDSMQDEFVLLHFFGTAAFLQCVDWVHANGHVLKMLADLP